MQHPAEPDDEYANELMYATAMAIQEASCEEGFLDDYFTSITDTGGIFLPDFLNHYPQWTTIFANNLATYGYNLTDILTNGFTAYGDEYHITMWSPYSNALYPEGIPAIGIATDIPDDDDSIFERIPAFIPSDNSCLFLEGAIGSSEQYDKCEILPYREQQTFLELNVIIVSFAQTNEQEQKSLTILTDGPSTSNWGPGDPNQCEFGLGLAIREFKMFRRLDRNKHDELRIYNSTSEPFEYCINPYMLPSSGSVADWRYSREEYRIHKNFLGQIKIMYHWLKEPQMWANGDPNQNILVNRDVVFIAWEWDRFAWPKTVEFNDPCGGGKKIYIRERMKYRGDIYAVGSLNPAPMGENWCIDQFGLYSQSNGAVKVVVQ
ncbi:hypothetical protein GC167_09100 [bacterium]|nr:hypothetical protein [bacterium]